MLLGFNPGIAFQDSWRKVKPTTRQTAASQQMPAIPANQVCATFSYFPYATDLVTMLEITR
ncbi:hypothetical protein GY45DRAFT_1324934 [Cubamyces sp. BRFM 1775]|nr:hypothetical protein GY45DRAFT_1324934 [Cubamyces sp. BRFM 1775]